MIWVRVTPSETVLVWCPSRKNGAATEGTRSITDPRSPEERSLSMKSPLGVDNYLIRELETAMEAGCRGLCVCPS